MDDHMKVHNEKAMDRHGLAGHMDRMMPNWLRTFTPEPFLFEIWGTKTVSGLVAAVLVSTFLTIFFECTNYAFNVYHLRAEKWHTRQNRIIAHMLLTLLRTVSVMVAYIMMLCVMSYNLWILLSVIVGSGLGHLVGRPLMWMTIQKKKQKENYRNKGEELLPDFEPLKELSEEKDQRRAVTNSLNLTPFKEKLLKYNYDDAI